MKSLISSLAEFRVLTAGLTGALLAIPFGVDDEVECMHLPSPDITDEQLSSLLARARPMSDGIRRIHVIAAPPRFEPTRPFYLTST